MPLTPPPSPPCRCPVHCTLPTAGGQGLLGQVPPAAPVVLLRLDREPARRRVAAGPRGGGAAGVWGCGGCGGAGSRPSPSYLVVNAPTCVSEPAYRFLLLATPPCCRAHATTITSPCLGAACSSAWRTSKSSWSVPTEQRWGCVHVGTILTSRLLLATADGDCTCVCGGPTAGGRGCPGLRVPQELCSDGRGLR